MLTAVMLVKTISQETSPTERLYPGRRDQDLLGQETRHRPAIPAPACPPTKTEAVSTTTSERRRTSHALGNTGRRNSSMVPTPTSDQGLNLYENSEADIVGQPRREASTVMAHPATTDRGEHLLRSPEAGTAGPCRRAKSSITATKPSGRKGLGRDPRGHTEVHEVRQSEQTELEIITIARRIDLRLSCLPHSQWPWPSAAMAYGLLHRILSVELLLPYLVPSTLPKRLTFCFRVILSPLPSPAIKWRQNARPARIPGRWLFEPPSFCLRVVSTPLPNSPSISCIPSGSSWFSICL